MDKKFNDEMHKIGRAWTSFAVVALMAMPFLMSWIFKAKPNFNGIILGSLSICLIYIPSSIIEVITYSPMLGTGGTYLAFVTGNLINLKIPCVMNAQRIAKTDHGSLENEIVSTIAVAISSLVTCLILIVGVILLVPLTPILQAPILAPAFNTVVPALFGALGYQYFSKQPVLVVGPLISMAFVSLVFPNIGSQIGILVPMSALISIGIARILFKKNKI